jgi:hypothetical protein
MNLTVPTQSASKVLRAYRLAKDCSPTDAAYAKWARFAVGFEDARRRIMGLDKPVRRSALESLLGAGARAWPAPELSETESYWANLVGEDADWFFLAGNMRIPLSVSILEAPLTQGKLTALVRATPEPLENCSTFPGRGMICDDERNFFVDETDFLCKGKPAMPCSLELHPDRTPKAVFDAQGICTPTVYLGEPTPESATAYRTPVVQPGRRADESILDCIERLKVPVYCKTPERITESVTWSCNPGYRVSDDGKTCISEAVTCPPGQVLGLLGTCITPQSTPQPTGETVGGISQFNQPTLETAPAGNIASPVAPPVPGFTPPILPSPLPSSPNLNFQPPPPIIGFVPPPLPPLYLAPLSGPRLSRMANMGVGLPRRRS